MTGLKGLQTGFCEVAGAGLYYETAGEGPDLVFVHAGFVDSRMWEAQFAFFAQAYRVTRYDLRGFGRSRFAAGDFSHRQDLVELLNYLGIERTHLVGCSLGGGVAIDFALEHPGRVDSLVLVDSALGGYQMSGEMPKPLQDLLAALGANDLPRAAEIAVVLWIAGPFRTVDQVPVPVRQLAYEMSLTALPNFFVREAALNPPAVARLEEIKAPALVVLGELDDPSLAAIGEVLVTRIAGARRATIPAAAHVPGMERPEVFNSLVAEFLRGK